MRWQLLSLLMLGNTLLHCTVTVGQSVIWAMVMVSSLGSPLHECVVGEGTSSLNHPLNHCHCHLSCSTLTVGCQL